MNSVFDLKPKFSVKKIIPVRNLAERRKPISIYINMVSWNEEDQLNSDDENDCCRTVFLRVYIYHVTNSPCFFGNMAVSILLVFCCCCCCCCTSPFFLENPGILVVKTRFFEKWFTSTSRQNKNFLLISEIEIQVPNYRAEIKNENE